ncbi:MAG: hypothetical protein KDB84_11905, partial [Flavobacteriales bacterium]|nr:hypothetical protein [Flavobacteriales bacterium]
MRTPKPLLAIGFSIAMFSGRAQLTYHQVGLADQITGPGASLLTPFVDYFENHKTSLLYKAPDLLAAGVQAGPIHSIRFYVVDLNGCGLLEDFAVRMTNTPATTLSSYLGGTNVWGPASYQPVAGTNTFELNVPFAWDGTSNLYVEICKGPSLPNTGDFASGNARVYVNGTSYTAFRGYFADNTLNLCSTTLSNANSTAVPTIWVGQVVDCLGAVDGPALPGMPCSDGDACTENDTYQLDCQCIGSPLPDTDGDDICDTQDACPNDPDNDADGDGLCADIDPCPLAVSGIADFNDATCNCDPGYYKVTSLMGSNTVITGCTICPPGSYCPDGLAALPCAAGTYNPVPGATECIACAFDEFSIPGATSCSFDPTCTTVLSLDITLPGFALNGPTYELRRVVNDQLIAEGGGGFMNQGVTPLAFCVPNGSFYLKMNNMVAGARYVLRKAGNPGTRIIDNIATLSGVNRVDEFTVSPSQLSSRGAVQIPPGPTELLYTSCDKQFWKKGEFIVVNEDPDVAAEWVPGGGTAGQSSTTGYDFWFYDPNGGYSFIRQRRHNVTDGFGNVGSARTCHMQVNNWA